MTGAIEWPLLIGFGGYLVLMIVVGFTTVRYMRSLDDFVLGGRRLGPWVAAISERASGESAWFLLGLPTLPAQMLMRLRLCSRSCRISCSGSSAG